MYFYYNLKFTGKGEKSFCAGGDVVSVTKDKTIIKDFTKKLYHLIYLSGTAQIPYVALLDGRFYYIKYLL